VQNNGGLPSPSLARRRPTQRLHATTSLGTSTQIPAYSSLTETVQFHPTSAGAVTSSWAITSSAGSQTLNVTSTGIDVPGAATNVTANPAMGWRTSRVGAILRRCECDHLIRGHVDGPDGEWSRWPDVFTRRRTDHVSGGRPDQRRFLHLQRGSDQYRRQRPASSPSSAVTPTVPASWPQPAHPGFNDLQVGTTSDLSFNVENNGDTPSPSRRRRVPLMRTIQRGQHLGGEHGDSSSLIGPRDRAVRSVGGGAVTSSWPSRARVCQ